MQTLMDAASLVPFKESEDLDEDRIMASLGEMPLDDLLDIMVLPNEKNSPTVEWTFEALGEYHSSQLTDLEKDDIVKSMMESVDIIEEVKKRERADFFKSLGKKLIKSIIERTVKKVLKTVIKRIIRYALEALWDVVETVVRYAVRGVVEWLIRPIFTGILEFVGVNPELWPFVAVAGGIAALGWLVYDKLFKGASTGLPPPETNTLGIANEADLINIPEPETVSDQGRSLIAEAPRPAGAPLAVRPPTDLGGLISRGEGTYNSVNMGAAHGYKAETLPLTTMTLGQIMADQKAHNYNAVGRYQIIGQTLADAVRYLKLPSDTLFNEATQDRIFKDYLIGFKRKAMGDYVSGKSNNLNAAILAASQEWASVAAPPGATLANGSVGDGTVSYYAGVANNKASISATEMGRALMAEREKNVGGSLTQIQNQQANLQPGVTVSNAAATPSKQAQAQSGAGGLMPQPSGNKTILTGKNGEMIAVNT